MRREEKKGNEKTHKFSAFSREFFPFFAPERRRMFWRFQTVSSAISNMQQEEKLLNKFVCR
jgi:hypothetical protein